MSELTGFDKWWSEIESELSDHLRNHGKDIPGLDKEKWEQSVQSALRDFQSMTKLAFEAGGHAALDWLANDPTPRTAAVLGGINQRRSDLLSSKGTTH